jgi:hypothetical protein
MWTSKNRGRYDRSKLRYPSDLTLFDQKGLGVGAGHPQESNFVREFD